MNLVDPGGNVITNTIVYAIGYTIHVSGPDCTASVTLVANRVQFSSTRTHFTPYAIDYKLGLGLGESSEGVGGGLGRRLCLRMPKSWALAAK